MKPSSKSKTDAKRRAHAVLVAAIALAALGPATGSGPFLLGGHDAHAVIGRPLTPMSYAGVARRTTRRAVAYGAYGGYGAGVHPYVGTGVVTTAPPACGAFVGGYATCGAVGYRAYYSGPNLVYAPVP